MSDIVIKSVTSTTGDGTPLLDSGFDPNGTGKFSFSDKNNKPKANNLAKDSTFSFVLDYVPGVTWTLKIKSISATTKTASGTWVYVDDEGDGSGDGTFQAQAGVKIGKAASSSQARG